MKVKTLIDNLSQTYFQFANFLLEDELQAMQLIVDVVSAIAIEDRELLIQIEKSMAQIEVYKRIFLLAQRRSLQLGGGSRVNSVGLFEKTTYFLSKRRGFGHKEVASVTGASEIEIIQSLELVRASILEKHSADSWQGPTYAN